MTLFSPCLCQNNFLAILIALEHLVGNWQKIDKHFAKMHITGAIGCNGMTRGYFLPSPVKGLLAVLPSDWMFSARSLPLIAVVCVILTARMAWGQPTTAGRLWAARSGFAMFALLMLLKVLFSVILAHYGFALAVCAMALMFSALLEWLPRSGPFKQSGGIVLRWAVLAWLISTSIGFWSMTEASFAIKNVAVG
ncbi:MAG: hypothetical protein L3J33_05310, partial [Rhodobacteraceae bacterium]|nr:hypothetical protein [Paracoccaceae bacterium]